MIHSNWLIGLLCVLSTIAMPLRSQCQSAHTIELIDTIFPSQDLYEDGNELIGFYPLNRSSWVVGYNGGYLVEVDGGSITIDTLDCEPTYFVFYQPDEYLLISLEGLFHFRSGVMRTLSIYRPDWPVTIHRNDQDSFTVLCTDGLMHKYEKKHDTWSNVSTQGLNTYTDVKDVIVFDSDTVLLTFDTLTWRSRVLDSLSHQGVLPVDIFDIDGRDDQLYLLSPTHICVVNMKTGELFSRPHGVAYPLNVYATSDDLVGVTASGGEIHVFALRPTK